jgi:2-amino-4-hydroxy-6-hydroxymethyldihydropteridine diphosphokinase
MSEVAVSLGSNLGDREAWIASGVQALRRDLEDLCLSSLYETTPVHLEDQPSFLNACCTGRTRLTPHQLLSQLQDAELAAGRDRTGSRYGPRTLDLDLLLYGNEVIEDPELVVPHPRLRERGFVLMPLSEIAADWIVPASRGEEADTVGSLADRVGRNGIRRIGVLDEQDV